MKPSDILPGGPAFDPRKRFNRVQEMWERYPLRTPEQCEAYTSDIMRQFIRSVKARPTEDILISTLGLMDDLAIENGIFKQVFPTDVNLNSSINIHEEFSLQRAAELKAFYLDKLHAILEYLGTLTLPTSGVGTIPLIDAIGRQQQIVEMIVVAMLDTTLTGSEHSQLFRETRARVLANHKVVSGLRFDAEIKDTSKIIRVGESRLTGTALVEAFLGGTPWEEFLKTPIPFNIALNRRLEHTVIVGGTGAGKTQLLQKMILNDLEKPDPPSIIVLDSTGQMVDRIQRLAVFSDRLRDRLLVIDPAHAPAMNMFDLNTPRFASYTPEQREDTQAEIISLFNYIFATESYGLTARMDTAFAYAVKLIMSIPGATITDLRQLLEEPPSKGGYQHSAFKHYIDELGQDARDFFATHFFAQTLSATRTSVAQRLHKVVGIPAFRRMFTAATNTIDFFSDMQAGKIILINTNQNLLKEDAYVLFGRYIIARVIAAAFERASVPEDRRRPAFLVIDESAPYFDQTFDSLLTRVRQFKLGVVIAFQHMEQANERLRSAIAANTSVKFVAKASFTDRRWLAREMETTPEFIQAQKQHLSGDEPWTQFALFVRNVTSRAISLTVPIGALEREPKMGDDDLAALMIENVRRITPPAIPEAKLQEPEVKKIETETVIIVPEDKVVLLPPPEKPEDEGGWA